MSSLLHSLRRNAPPLTPEEFLRHHADCWIQYFDDYPWATKFRYDAPQIEAQKKAVVDSKSLGWLLWNAGSLFDRGGIAPKS